MRKEIAIVIALAVLGIAVFGATTLMNQQHPSMQYWTKVTHQVIRADGTVEPVVDDGSNLVVNTGLNFTRDLLFNTESGQPINIGLGNYSGADFATLLTINTTANTNAPIADCNLAAAAGSVAVVSTSIANESISKVWTSNCAGPEIVNTTALYNSTTMSGFGSTTLMFAGKNFSSPVTLYSGDQLNVTWYVWVNTG